MGGVLPAALRLVLGVAAFALLFVAMNDWPHPDGREHRVRRWTGLSRGWFMVLAVGVFVGCVIIRILLPD